MADFKEMYFELAAKVAAAIEILTEAQQEGELAYMLGGEDSVADSAEKSKND